ncbi:MAG: zinc-ribbon domain-containing protein [Clostridiaceae bacterium]|nr:zinc-ribbon domain-containing protein [Clostridiaceae bacterium]
MASMQPRGQPGQGFCPNCGSPHCENSKFCAYCGHRIQ